MEIGGVILAAGYSSRAGDFKLTKKIGGRPVIEYAVEKLAGVCGGVCVVTGFGEERLGYLAEKYAAVRLVYNRDYERGMFSSVLAGLRAMEAERIFLLPGDCPAVRAQTFREMLKSDCGILVPAFQGKTGHPALMKQEAAREAANSGCATLREFIRKYGFQTVQTDDPGVLMDIDWPEDFAEIENYLAGQEHGNDHHGSRQQRQDNQAALPLP